MVHGTIQEVSVVPIPCVSASQCKGGETSRLRVCVHVLNDKHVEGKLTANLSVWGSLRLAPIKPL